MGSTDIMFALATGTTWMRRPESIKVTFTGRLGTGCNGRDVTLALLSVLGEHGARYRTVEFHDESELRISQDERFAICNMSVEMGAKFGVFVPDQVTAEFCEKRDGVPPVEPVRPDAGASYEREIKLDLSQLRPMVARPWSPANVIALEDLERTPITMAFLGSCASGRLSDLRAAAQTVDGHKVHDHVRFVVIPASMQVFREALKLGYVETLTAAGAVFNQSSCGPCGGIDKGVLASSDVCVSTSNRNYRGRMGHWDSETYLASARTVALAALDGYVGGPPR
jgi:3-isopropylmalate/(R)-2-methylmalate dehydratase large subunit